MKNSLSIIIITTILITGCATSPDNLPTTYISPLKYKKYDCEQLTEEIDNVSHRVATLHTSLENKADNDTAQAAGAILLWPTLFFLEGGDGPEATEYSNLKGAYEAIRVAMLRKKCSTEFLPPSPNEIIKEKEKIKNNSQNSLDNNDEDF